MTSHSFQRPSRRKSLTLAIVASIFALLSTTAFAQYSDLRVMASSFIDGESNFDTTVAWADANTSDSVLCNGDGNALFCSQLTVEELNEISSKGLRWPWTPKPMDTAARMEVEHACLRKDGGSYLLSIKIEASPFIPSDLYREFQEFFVSSFPGLRLTYEEYLASRPRNPYYPNFLILPFIDFTIPSLSTAEALSRLPTVVDAYFLRSREVIILHEIDAQSRTPRPAYVPRENFKLKCFEGGS